MRGYFSGYKTYFTAAATILLAVGSYLSGEPLFGHDVATAHDMVQLVVTAIFAATIRHGISTSKEG